MWRIVYLITELDIGGAENSLYQLLTRLDKEKYSPTVVSLTHRGRVGERLEEKKIPVICLNMRSKRDLSVFFKLAELLRERKPHILHTYLFHANFIGRIVGRYLRVPIIISSVRVMEKERPYHLYLNMLSYWMVDKQVCVSKKVEKF
ncbi:MAG TPA: hypothetical protein EYP78_00215, partial [Candidatus Omnitrophica bacterium]|nr:hypothetical protein [Candidatus Omnitrophota bacterium]